jgi:hypothetical protein
MLNSSLLQPNSIFQGLQNLYDYLLIPSPLTPAGVFQSWDLFIFCMPPFLYLIYPQAAQIIYPKASN